MSDFQPIKVAVFGSCVTIDNFNRTFNPGYKDLFECVAMADHVSMVSLMSDPINVDPATLDGLETRIFDKLQREFSRAYLSELKDSQPDYLVMDFWPDLIFGFARLGGGEYITNNAWSTVNTMFYKAQEADVCRINSRTDEFMTVWTAAVDRFMAYIQEECPHTRVVVHRSRNVGSWLDNSGATHDFSPWAASMNRHWEAMDDHLSANYEVDCIDVMPEGLQSFEGHPWGKFPVHYTFDYHALFLARMAQIALRHRSMHWMPTKISRHNLPRHRADAP
ncbi:DUF6270 domain-containing protein [Arthrobacter sp. UYCu712]|uniref:DUF6270 domain-containing protein n=1 Tax=Arthrobacter sp. UYCu712 TaxID=3156340 RepID=UPI0033948282